MLYISQDMPRSRQPRNTRMSTQSFSNCYNQLSIPFVSVKWQNCYRLSKPTVAQNCGNYKKNSSHLFQHRMGQKFEDRFGCACSVYVWSTFSDSAYSEHKFALVCSPSTSLIHMPIDVNSVDHSFSEHEWLCNTRYLN